MRQAPTPLRPKRPPSAVLEFTQTCGILGIGSEARSWPKSASGGFSRAQVLPCADWSRRSLGKGGKEPCSLTFWRPLPEVGGRAAARLAAPQPWRRPQANAVCGFQRQRSEEQGFPSNSCAELRRVAVLFFLAGKRSLRFFNPSGSSISAPAKLEIIPIAKAPSNYEDAASLAARL